MERGRVMRGVRDFGWAVAVVVAMVWGAAAKPNIIFILADDLGYGDLSCYGQQKFKTPNIDRLGSDGMLFTQMYAGSTVCAPSRCVLMSGQHTGHAQVRGNIEMRPEGQMPIARDSKIIPTVLREVGYVSGMFGKWGLGAPGSEGDPMNFFDEFYGYNCQALAHNYYPQHLWHNRNKVELKGEHYSHDLIMQHAKEFIRKNRERPFFCYMSVTIPHAAMQAPAELHEKYCKQYPQFNEVLARYGGAEVRNPVAAFPAMVEHLDNGIGEVVALLRELKLEENTLVVFTSDNGPHREGGHRPVFWQSGGPFRGIKRDLYEGGIRTPFVVKWPAVIKPGRKSEHVAAFWDVLPTFCEMAGVEVPGGLDGISLLSELKGEEQREHEYLYWEFHEMGGKQALRVGNYKGVRLQVHKNPSAAVELYDLSRDLGEVRNIAVEQPEVVKRMEGLFKEARVRSERFPNF